MPDEKKETDNINSLCKKYFTPELCDEPVLESKRSLELKLYRQMKNYGKKISASYMALSNEDKEEIIDDALINCFTAWKKSIPEKFTSFYFTTLKHAFINKNIKEGKKKEKECSINEENENGESLEATLADESENVKVDKNIEKEENREIIFHILRIVEDAYRLKMAENSKIWLSPALTQKLYDSLTSFIKSYGDLYLKRFTFIDQSILNTGKKTTMKEIAKNLKTNDGYLKKEIDKFFAPLQEQLKDFR